MPVSPASYQSIPFTYEMSMGVRKSDSALKAELDGVIGAQCGAIQKLLDEYRVPREGEKTCESLQASPSSAALR